MRNQILYDSELASWPNLPRWWVKGRLFDVTPPSATSSERHPEPLSERIAPQDINNLRRFHRSLEGRHQPLRLRPAALDRFCAVPKPLDNPCCPCKRRTSTRVFLSVSCS